MFRAYCTLYMLFSGRGHFGLRKTIETASVSDHSEMSHEQVGRITRICDFDWTYPTEGGL
jgi:hypothetical protein